jgi:hypothetical protein
MSDIESNLSKSNASENIKEEKESKKTDTANHTTSLSSSSSSATKSDKESPRLSLSDKRNVTFSLLLDPVNDDEIEALYGEKGDVDTKNANRVDIKQRAEINSLEVHTVLGNEQGLLDGGVDSKLDRPTGLTQSLDGNYLYFCEYGSHAIREATLSGPVLHTIAGQTGAGFQDGSCSTSRFHSPNGICVLPMGSGTSLLIVADTGNHAVRCVNLRSDKVSTILRGKSNGKTNDETGKNGYDVNIDDNKSEECSSNSINRSYDYSSSVGMQKQPKALFSGKHFDHIVLESPSGVCAAGENHPGVFFVCDSMKIIEVNLLSRTCRILAGGGDLEAKNGAGQRGHRDGNFRQALFDHPTGIAFNQSNGHLYIADSYNHVIRLLHNNQVTTIAGCGRAGYLDGFADASRFKFPQKIAVDSARRRLYVSDLNDVIRGVTLGNDHLRGRVWTVAGSGQPGRQDGPSVTSTWQFPCGLVYSESEKVLYCADSDNHCLRTVITHDGWVQPLDAELYVHRAMNSMLNGSEEDGANTKVSSSGVVLDGRHNIPSSDINVDIERDAGVGSPVVRMHSKFRRTLDQYVQKAKKELDNVHFAIFRTNYMIQHPSKTVLLLAEALAVILQDPDLSHPEINEIDYRDAALKASRMAIFQKRKKGPSLISQLQRKPIGQLSPRQIAKLVHCTQKLKTSQMSKAPDVHRLKRWINTRCDAERFIYEHNVLSTPFPPQSSVNIESNLLLENFSSPVRSKTFATLNDLNWEDGAGVIDDPDISSRCESNSAIGNNDYHIDSVVGGNQSKKFKSTDGSQRYAQLSYHEVCRENELLRKELDTMRQSSRLILDLIEGAIVSPGASANHLALHSILGIPQNSKTSSFDAQEKEDNVKSNRDASAPGVSVKVSTEKGDKMAQVKFQRQVRQASIIIEELERALGNPSTQNRDRDDE